MPNLSIGNEPNFLKLLVRSLELKPHSNMRGGVIEDAIHIRFSNYNIDNLLCQLIEEYGEEKLIDKIKAL